MKSIFHYIPKQSRTCLTRAYGFSLYIYATY